MTQSGSGALHSWVSAMAEHRIMPIRGSLDSFNSMTTKPAAVPEFNHSGRPRWLLENPSLLDGDSLAVIATLDRFKKMLKTFNALVP